MAPIVTKLVVAMALLAAPLAHADDSHVARAADDAQATPSHFVNSLYRVCLGPGLSNCLFPLHPGEADTAKANENTLPVHAAEGKRDVEHKSKDYGDELGTFGFCGAPGQGCKVEVKTEVVATATSVIVGGVEARATGNVEAADSVGGDEGQHRHAQTATSGSFAVRAGAAAVLMGAVGVLLAL